MDTSFLFLETLAMAFVVWRVTSLVIDEDGPLDIFLRFRNFVGVKFDEFSKPYGENFLSSLLSCFWCSSVWVSMAFSPFLSYTRDVWTWAWASILLSALAIIIDVVVRALLAFSR